MEGVDVSCTTPGAKRPAQVEDNVRAADLPPISTETVTKIKDIYGRCIRGLVHHLW